LRIVKPKVKKATSRSKTERSEKPMAVDLFCGCGGLTQGLKKAGFRVIASLDIDPLSVATYKLNHPEITVLETDIRKVKIKDFMKKLGLRKNQLDLLAGCPPCQGFSSIRTLNGGRIVDDSRNNLLLAFHRFVIALKPKTIMIENVPGLTADKSFKFFCNSLKKNGYKVDFKILDAAVYGVPQRRRRLILLASKKALIEFANPVKVKRTVRDAIGSLPRPTSKQNQLHGISLKRSVKIRELIKKIPKDGGSRTDLPEKDQLKCHKKCNGFKDVYGRMSWNQVAPTITGGCINPSKGRFLHPTQNRSITLREAALLQSFPSRYRFSMKNGRYPVAQMIGNALPPEFIRRHASMIYGHLNKPDEHKTRSGVPVGV